ncbi:uncharacterized protein UV8b_03322 [Ustilaginoidea virens]|uniref:Polyketide synthase n=1 Tax=Ustilaginoidea virens TaxID=1159556 RepID=A0A8E5MGP5_USTVR|nr:uncharacterized protein UV8b_03322 [Ustilaginoidea virens]QUC19081.1 hypothetical protein UV8b_03322 [Ustilaginoidea virens]
MARTATQTSASPVARTLLLFGPGAMTFDEAYFGRIAEFVQSDPASQWAPQTLQDVASNWALLCEEIPNLQKSQGLIHAEKLIQWLRTGAVTPASTVASLPNAILGPLVVIAQLVEYLQHLDSSTPDGLDRGKSFHVPPPDKTETVGCCLGVFSALVVSSSSSWSQFCHNAAAVVRIVFILGALSDAQDAADESGPSMSLVAFWRGGQSLNDLDRILAKFPEAYASVLYDDNRATVTTSTRTVAALRSHLQSSGVTTNDTEFHGRFHAGSLYGSDLEQLLSFCKTRPAFQLAHASRLVLPTRINSETVLSGRENPVEAASRAFVVQQFDWIRTFRAAVSGSLQNRASRVIEFGPERCVPPTLLRRLNNQVTHFDFESGVSSSRRKQSARTAPAIADNDVAVIGMACSVAGAQDVDQYWDLLLEGRSQHRELVPNDRFVMESAFRPHESGNDKKKWFGNFLDDHDAFDCRFFKKSPREALHMDPQQRLILQTAYQAVAQSGYYHRRRVNRRIGCYIGCVANDYENNISHTTPTAFSATGALRSYIAGKVSHYFGWTGPGMTLDTACSASTVAIDLACKSILSGDCVAALAGGTNFYSTPMFFQNLAAGSFLSATGQCKPFDARADGYCRGEAVGAVFLKKLSAAVADGDQILGVISATAVNQNLNTTPIFVPNPVSLTDVFRTVMRKAGLHVKDVSVVEAHGTGTPVGDPAEYDSIRQVFGGPERAGLKPLQIGSVKGLIGHTEGASGVVALIKILLMMQGGRIPPQASFSTINPAIKASSSDKMEITKVSLPWEGSSKVALINNYGAAGSNASMVIKQAPQLGPRTELGSQPSASIKYPIYISGLDEKRIQSYASRLLQYLKSKADSGVQLRIEHLAFNLYRQSNPSLSQALIFSSDSLKDVEQKLATLKTVSVPSPRPVILCFGGQVSKFVGLDQAVFDSSASLRRYLDDCDGVCKAVGAGSIYPGIFSRQPISDPSVLQPLLFSIQYATAMAWIESGAEPAAVVGHSFGELTALCVSGALTLESALKLVHGRSKIIRDAWGPEKGSMMAIEADQDIVDKLLQASNALIPESERNGEAAIACFNGPRSFTVAGSVAAIDALQQAISARESTDASLKHKRLDVTNAFHSALVEGLRPQLEALGRTIVFGEPKIPLVRATRQEAIEALTADYVAQHMREAVYFNDAIQRLSRKHPEAIWLEAGSNSTITAMASKALGLPKSSSFQAINITNTSQGLQQLADATMNLWKCGLRVAFWPHAPSQTYEYPALILPPYQFEKQRHWLEFKPPTQLMNRRESMTDSAGSQADMPVAGLFSFVGFLNSDRDEFQFRINKAARQYAQVESQYLLANSSRSIPVAFAVDLAIQAITDIRPELAKPGNLHPQIFNVVNNQEITDAARVLFLNFEKIHAEAQGWSFKFISKFDNAPITHLTGQLYFKAIDDAHSSLEFSRYERLVSHDRTLNALRNTEDAEHVIQGQSIYKVFSNIVEYGDMFTLLQKLVGRRSESVAKVISRRSPETWFDFALGESFTQVASIWANCMSPDRNAASGTVYIASSMEQWMRSPETLQEISAGRYDYKSPREWHVLAQHKLVKSDASFITDIFVFDAKTGSLEEIVLGVRYTAVSRSVLLTSASIPTQPSVEVRAGSSFVQPVPEAKEVLFQPQAAAKDPSPIRALRGPRKNAKTEIWLKLLPVLADISGLDPEEIKQSDTLADIGIDSLMGMEMAREVETTFHCTFEQSELVSLIDVPGILEFLQKTLGSDDDDSSDTSLDESNDSFSNGGTPSTPSTVADNIEYSAKYSCDQSSFDLPPTVVLDAFRESKSHTDFFLESHGCAGYLSGVSQKQTRLCLVLTSAAFKKLGCDLEAAQPGQVLQAVPCVERHRRFHQYLYKMLEETRIVNIDDGVITRTPIPLPSQTAEAILADLMKHHADNGSSHQLTYNVGSRMADVLSGKADGPALIFGDAKNRELVASFYGELPFNKLCFEQMADFLTRLAGKLGLASQSRTTLRILEMGAGTGGTTKVLVPVLAKLGIPVEYTFTDLSPSLVAQAKRKFKQYPFMKFAVHDIEQPPGDADLIGSQHVVIASNAVHATHSLNVSAQNIRKFLRPDGFLMMLEMMGTLHWVDVVWGTLEGWWLFDDGRTHAIVDEARWEKELLGAGYKHVEWTDGKLPEVRVQRVLIALASESGDEIDRLPSLASSISAEEDGDSHHGLPPGEATVLKQVAASYVESSTRGFSIPESSGEAPDNAKEVLKVVLITGATGSLGSHITTHLASLESVDKVYCLNRHGQIPGAAKARQKEAVRDRDPRRRQIQSLESKHIYLDNAAMSKITVMETDSWKPRLGLSDDRYQELVDNVTHIIHNAFPVNGLIPLKQNEPQFATMRNLVDLAAAATARRHVNFKFTFQFISSLSAVGRYPFVHAGKRQVPEEHLDIDSALPNGYGGAKQICERILRDTLGRRPDRFRAMTVRLGQLSGSTETGYWNHMEVLGFLFKSAQTLRLLPTIDGVLSWLPLEEAAGALADLLLRDGPDCYPVYHLDNPVRTAWNTMIPVLAEALGVPQKGLVPLGEWLRRVQAYPGENPWDNPAAKALDFFQHKFEHMSCGGVLMATERAQEHSATLRAARPIDDEAVKKHIEVWKRAGFLR